jgi:hypothetical protein
VLTSKKILLMMMGIGAIMQVVGQDHAEEKSFVFFENSQIQHDSLRYQSYAVKAGEFIVFQWLTDNGGEPGNYSVAESVMAFQVENGVEEFELKDEEIFSHQGLYAQRCRCQDRRIQPIHSGVIHGKKMKSGNWMIEIDAVSIGLITGKTYHLLLNGEFKSAKG